MVWFVAYMYSGQRSVHDTLLISPHINGACNYSWERGVRIGVKMKWHHGTSYHLKGGQWQKQADHWQQRFWHEQTMRSWAAKAVFFFCSCCSSCYCSPRAGRQLSIALLLAMIIIAWFRRFILFHLQPLSIHSSFTQKDTKIMMFAPCNVEQYTDKNTPALAWGRCKGCEWRGEDASYPVFGGSREVILLYKRGTQKPSQCFANSRQKINSAVIWAMYYG